LHNVCTTELMLSDFSCFLSLFLQSAIFMESVVKFIFVPGIPSKDRLKDRAGCGWSY
jgi:hypothetical protein